MINSGEGIERERGWTEMYFLERLVVKRAGALKRQTFWVGRRYQHSCGRMTPVATGQGLWASSVVGQDAGQGKNRVGQEILYAVTWHLNNTEAMVIIWMLNLGGRY